MKCFNDRVVGVGRKESFGVVLKVVEIVVTRSRIIRWNRARCVCLQDRAILEGIYTQTRSKEFVWSLNAPRLKELSCFLLFSDYTVNKNMGELKSSSVFRNIQW